MINFKYEKKYCCEDAYLIDNYEQAVKDKQFWDCHHRLETDLGLSADELKEQDKYFNVPASELIFMTRSDHLRLHHQGENNINYGKKFSEGTKQKMHKSAKKRYEDPKEKQKTGAAMKKRFEDPKERQKIGAKIKDRTWMNNGITRARPKTQEEIKHYLELGYDFGYKLK